MTGDRVVMATVLAAMLSTVPRLASAQGVDRTELPLRSAKPSSQLRRRFESDWDDKIGDGLEWAYCITQWHVELSQDGDTVFVADRAVLAVPVLVERTRMIVDCSDRDGEPLPLAHAHVEGDCSESRKDVVAALQRKAPFELIICGRGATRGYTYDVYERAIAGGQAR